MKLPAILATAATCVVLAACIPDEPKQSSAAQQAEQRNRQAQDDVYARASAAVPVPRVDNFVARENIAEYMRRMDDPSSLWFVYLLSDFGDVIGYHVGTYPQSVCTYMTPPERVREHRVDWGQYYGSALTTTTAPALDGVFYAGGGCSTSFMFDDVSGAMIFIGDLKFLAYDVPLDIEAPRFGFAAGESPTDG